ncbi:MAG: glycogen synthase GlgA [Pseudomonadota bacterium]
MNILCVASECAPFLKTGGLADVVGALPKALGRLGVKTRVVLPAYPALAPIAATGVQVASYDHSAFGTLNILDASADGLDLFLVVAPQFFDRPGNPYLDAWGNDFSDNALRFGALSYAAARLAHEGAGGFRADVLHAHDWQAGLAPAYLRFAGNFRVATVTTIHNIAFQGVFPPSLGAPLGLPSEAFNIDGFEYHGGISFLKAGLIYADRITTVSPTYARELSLPEFGLGFEGIVGARRNELSGVLNGVDLDIWNPATDPHLTANYDASSLVARSDNRKSLLERFGLAIDDGAPLFCIVSRLTTQKGIDLVLEALPRLLARGAGLVVLGTGSVDLENGLRAAARAHPTRIGVEIGYDEGLSHAMQGGADLILVPSRFEPCGLTQLYGLRYGCLPLVARTGGLADTVIDANEAALAAGVANGFQFSPVTSAALGDAIDRACDAFSHWDLWRAMMQNAMAHPVGWDTSAAAYKTLYETTKRELSGAAP